MPLTLTVLAVPTFLLVNEDGVTTESVSPLKRFSPNTTAASVFASYTRLTPVAVTVSGAGVIFAFVMAEVFCSE